MITGSEAVITRSGYTTIMELVSLNISALLIPTPGQTEQEYLAEYLSAKGWFSLVNQVDINDSMPVKHKRSVNYTWITAESRILLTAALNELLEERHKKR